MYPKILLVCNIHPLESGIGEIFLRELAEDYPRSRMVRFSTTQRQCEETPIDWNGIQAHVRYVKSPVLPVISSVYDQWYQYRRLSDHIKAIQEIVKEHDINMIWIVLNHTIIIRLAYVLLHSLKLPIVSTVWDSPEYLMKMKRLDIVTRAELLRMFEYVMKRSLRVSTASESMRTIYKMQYGIDSIPLIHGLPQERWMPAKVFGGKSTTDVVFAGSLYAKKEWNALIRAVADHNERHSQKIRVTFIGRFPRFFAARPPWLQLPGQLTLESTLREVHNADVAYLPYWLDKAHSFFAKTAFPNKLSTYVAAGIPVLYHGPEDSTPSEFIKKHPIGVCCHSLDRQSIIMSIKECVTSDSFATNYPEAQKTVLQDVLGKPTMISHFRQLIGAE